MARPMEAEDRRRRNVDGESQEAGERNGHLHKASRRGRGIQPRALPVRENKQKSSESNM